MARKAAAKPRARRSPPKKVEHTDKAIDGPGTVIGPTHEIETEPAQAQPVDNGPTTGYRDQGDEIEYCQFDDGVIPKGWVDTPALCENEYAPAGLVRVVLRNGEWVR